MIIVGPFKLKVFCNKLPLPVIFIRSILKRMYLKMKSYIYWIMEHHYEVQVPDGTSTCGVTYPQYKPLREQKLFLCSLLLSPLQQNSQLYEHLEPKFSAGP